VTISIFKAFWSRRRNRT